MSKTRISTPVLAVLALALAGVVPACGGASSSESAPTAHRWREAPSYTYVLRSSGGERALIGTFAVTVREGRTTGAVGLDEDSRRVVKQLGGRVPTIGELLAEAETARDEDADVVDVDRARDGRPTHITVDWAENAIDDEAEYAIGDYRPAAGGRGTP